MCTTVPAIADPGEPEVFDWPNLRRRWPAKLPRTIPFRDLARDAAARDSSRTLAPRVALVLAVEACKGRL